jgi:acyl-coenzyme A synthetase/AMP-(fatty) acid ligase
MSIISMISAFTNWADRPALAWRNRELTYASLHETVGEARSFLVKNGVDSGDVAALHGDFTPASISMLLAMIERRCVVVPVNRTTPPEAVADRLRIGKVQHSIVVDESDVPAIAHLQTQATHEHYEALRDRNAAGLVLFTSGSTGEPKGVVHDFSKLLVKFETPRPPQRILNFLLFDHWGGLNTMFHTLSNGGTVLSVEGRAPDEICRLVEQYRAEVLPASPTFLRLLLLSGAYQRHDLSSLRVITYGTEPMPQSTLERLNEVFPEVQIKQTYGLIELGVVRTQSKDDGSLWCKLGGEGYDFRVVDGKLEIKAESAMLGYLNAPSPFTSDGWFITGDRVEVDGEYVRILGRESEQINVGGEKVFPIEVESVICEVGNVAEAIVYSEPNAVTGRIVCADVRLVDEEARVEAVKRIKSYCYARLESYKVPVKIRIVSEITHSERGKTLRPQVGQRVEHRAAQDGAAD